MEKVLTNLKPTKVFEFFEDLCHIPHGSGNVKEISDFLVQFAKDRGLKCRQDEANNVIIWKNASAGYENAPAYIIQGHMDMVCAKTLDCSKDMAKEGLDLMTDGKFVWADKTSLGGDDSIAVACMMAILDDESLKHPALEMVITTDEETGMDGAVAIDFSDLKAKRLLNVDSEEEGVFTLSCAGGARVDGFVATKTCDVPKDYLVARIKTYGFLGGHSGCDIADGRGSANYVLGQFLYFASTHNSGMLIVSANGGELDNVITTEAEAIIAAPADAINPINSMCLRFREKIKEELGAVDPNAEIQFELIGRPEEGMKASCLAKTQKILSLWSKLPQGVIRMLPDFPGIPETSLNMGTVCVDEEGFKVTYLVRSSIEEEKAKLISQLKTLIGQARGTLSVHSEYPAWPYRAESEFRDLAEKVFKDLYGKAPGLAATHGGLECGLFINKVADLDVISIGPDILDIHSPRERLSVESTARIYEFICKLLEESLDRKA